MTVTLRPASLGELVDRTTNVWRAHWKALFRLTIGFQLVQYVLLKTWELASLRLFPVAHRSKELTALMQSDPPEAFRQFGSSLGLGLIAFSVMIVVSLVGTVGVAAYARAVLLGRPATVPESFAVTWSKVPAVVGASARMALWGVVTLLAWCTPGALVLAGAIATPKGPAQVVVLVIAMLLMIAGGVGGLLWWAVRLALISPALAESTTGAEAVRRARAASWGRFGPGAGNLAMVRLAIGVTLVGLVLTIVTFVAGVPALAIQAVWGNVFDPMNQTPDLVPQGLLVPAQLVQIVAQALVAPLLTVAMTAFFVDTQVRREGLDLALALERPAT